MNSEQILKVLKNKRDCIKYNHDYCYENCEGDCPYFVSSTEALEVLDFLIKSYESPLHPTPFLKCDTTSKLSQEEYQRLIDRLKGIKAQPVSAIGIDIYGKEHFKGICPYINNPCEKWTCGICEVEERERKFMEGDTD